MFPWSSVWTSSHRGSFRPQIGQASNTPGMARSINIVAIWYPQSAHLWIPLTHLLLSWPRWMLLTPHTSAGAVREPIAVTGTDGSQLLLIPKPVPRQRAAARFAARLPDVPLDRVAQGAPLPTTRMTAPIADAQLLTHGHSGLVHPAAVAFSLSPPDVRTRPTPPARWPGKTLSLPHRS